MNDAIIQSSTDLLNESKIKEKKAKIDRLEIDISKEIDDENLDLIDNHFTNKTDKKSEYETRNNEIDNSYSNSNSKLR